MLPTPLTLALLINPPTEGRETGLVNPLDVVVAMRQCIGITEISPAQNRPGLLFFTDTLSGGWLHAPRTRQ